MGDAEPIAIDPCPPRSALEALVAHDGARIGSLDDHAGLAAVATHTTRCPRCAASLAAIRADHELLLSLAAVGREPSATGALERPWIPNYELGDEIASGAQGVVLRAVQQKTGRTVAIKLLTDGRFATSRQPRRVEREIEVVAGLRHPGIVTLYDGGIADAGSTHSMTRVSWFAVEFVEGDRLDRWAERTHAMPLRLAVFARIVDAVAAAHRHGVIHRDLKPDNIRRIHRRR